MTKLTDYFIGEDKFNYDKFSADLKEASKHNIQGEFIDKLLQEVVAHPYGDEYMETLAKSLSKGSISCIVDVNQQISRQLFTSAANSTFDRGAIENKLVQPFNRYGSTEPSNAVDKFMTTHPYFPPRDHKPGVTFNLEQFQVQRSQANFVALHNY